jgi:putative FmdB family regulatory protein
MKGRIAVPIYEFVCQSCGHEFELIQSFSDSRMPACDRCQSEQVVRRVGRPAVHFKGSGWYITDSKKSGNGKNGASKPAEKAAAGDGGADGEKSAVGDKKAESAGETAKASAEPAKAAD